MKKQTGGQLEVEPPSQKIQVLSPSLKIVKAPEPQAQSGSFANSGLLEESGADLRADGGPSASKSNSEMDISGSKLSMAVVTPTAPMSIDMPTDGSRPIIDR